MDATVVLRTMATGVAAHGVDSRALQETGFGRIQTGMCGNIKIDVACITELALLSPFKNPLYCLIYIECDNFYVQRGCDSEHRIKELKLGIKADRLSCSTFIANQFRLLLSQAAYILMISIRQAAAGTQLATAQVERHHYDQVASKQELMCEFGQSEAH